MAGGAREEGRAIFVSNFAPGTTAREITALFQRYGAVSRLDMKRGFCFIFMADEEAGRAALTHLHDSERLTDPARGRLVVQWARGDGAVKRREDERRRASLAPNETLFVVNFDPTTTQQSHLNGLFEKHGRIVRLDLNERFAFVQYEAVEDATAALKELNGYMLQGRRLIVEYTTHSSASNNRSSRKRDRSVSPRRGGARSGGRRSPKRHQTDRADRDYDADRRIRDGRDRGRDRDHDRERDRDRDRDRDLNRERERERGRDRDRERDRDRDGVRDRIRERYPREEYRDLDGPSLERDRGRDRDRDRYRLRERDPEREREQRDPYRPGRSSPRPSSRHHSRDASVDPPPRRSPLSPRRSPRRSPSRGSPEPRMRSKRSRSKSQSPRPVSPSRKLPSPRALQSNVSMSTSPLRGAPKPSWNDDKSDFDEHRQEHLDGSPRVSRAPHAESPSPSRRPPTRGSPVAAT